MWKKSMGLNTFQMHCIWEGILSAPGRCLSPCVLRMSDYCPVLAFRSPQTSTCPCAWKWLISNTWMEKLQLLKSFSVPVSLSLSLSISPSRLLYSARLIGNPRRHVSHLCLFCNSWSSPIYPLLSSPLSLDLSCRD